MFLCVFNSSQMQVKSKQVILTLRGCFSIEGYFERGMLAGLNPNLENMSLTLYMDLRIIF